MAADDEEGGGGGGGGGDGEMLAALAELLDTDGSQLGLGRDADKSIKYSRLELAAAWQVDCEPSVYEARLRKVAQQMNTIARQGCMPPEPTKGRPYRTDPVRRRLGLASDGVAAEANEALLVHGTSPALLLPLLSEGCLNERFSGRAFKRRPAFGDGVYLAEDAGKADQYCEADGEYDRLSELHRLLYPRGADAHPGGPLHFLLVCRVALGADPNPHDRARVDEPRPARGLRVPEVVSRAGAGGGGDAADAVPLAAGREGRGVALPRVCADARRGLPAGLPGGVPAEVRGSCVVVACVRTK